MKNSTEGCTLPPECWLHSLEKSSTFKVNVCRKDASNSWCWLALNTSSGAQALSVQLAAECLLPSSCTHMRGLMEVGCGTQHLDLLWLKTELPASFATLLPVFLPGCFWMHHSALHWAHILLVCPHYSSDSLFSSMLLGKKKCPSCSPCCDN